MALSLSLLALFILAHLHGDRVTVLVNHYGEFWPELVLLGFIFIFAIYIAAKALREV